MPALPGTGKKRAQSTIAGGHDTGTDALYALQGFRRI